MARFINRAGLRTALRAHDWEAFARGYNGPAYKANGYHRKMAAAYARFAAMDVARETPGRRGDDPPLPPPASPDAKAASRPGLRGLAPSRRVAGRLVFRGGVPRRRATPIVDRTGTLC